MSEFNLTDYNDGFQAGYDDGYARGYCEGFADGGDRADSATYDLGYGDGLRDQKASSEIVEPWHGKVRSYNPGDN